MATLNDLVVEVRRAWWLDFYLHGVLFVAVVMDCEPDMEKVMNTVLRGTRWRFKGARRWQRF
jgi:hypothetical protein